MPGRAADANAPPRAQTSLRSNRCAGLIHADRKKYREAIWPGSITFCMTTLTISYEALSAPKRETNSHAKPDRRHECQEPTIGAVAAAASVNESGQQEIDGLLPLALSRPREALARARAVLEGQPGPYEASVAHQAAGIVVRDIGDVRASVRELRVALGLAQADRLGRAGN